jgi:hypothetical protein
VPTFNRDDALLALNPIAWLRQQLRNWGLELFCKRYYGTYAGVVVANADPEGLYRIRALCPAVGLTDADAVPDNYWAWPCLPGLGNDAEGHSGGEVWVPDVGSNVWLEFEGGDPEHPIYKGGWVTTRKAMPELDHAAALRKGVRTRAGHYLRFSDDGADLHITLARGDGAGGQSATFLTFDKAGSVTVANDHGSLVYLDAERDALSVINAALEGGSPVTQALLMLGKDEVTLATKSGATLGMKGRDITLNGDNIIVNGKMVNLASLQVYLGKNASEPAVRGNKLAVTMGTHVHVATAPGAPTTPPTTPPPILGNELSNTVFIA